MVLDPVPPPENIFENRPRRGVLGRAPRPVSSRDKVVEVVAVDGAGDALPDADDPSSLTSDLTYDADLDVVLANRVGGDGRAAWHQR